MTPIDTAALDRALTQLPGQFRGPAGVAGVVKDGQVIARSAWGYADMATRLPMTVGTRLPICSISKQMTCALLLDLFDGPEVLDPLLPALLPNLAGPRPTVAHLCHNQSGLRDYWAQTVLQGAAPEGVCTLDTGLALIGRARSLHFAPGTGYSYSNGNFRLLAELIARAAGRPFADLLKERVFDRAGMRTAVLSPDAALPLDGVVGHEGNDETGFLPARTAIHWLGDAGVSASLDDMLAWECHIDATRDDPAGLYARISAPVQFASGRPASYGYGLRREVLAGHAVTSHGGALRGFSAHRLHVAAERLSVVVMFNHEAGAMRAAWALLEAALGCTILPDPAPGQGWGGLWLDPVQGLLLRLTDLPAGVRLHYGTTPALLSPAPDGSLRGGDVVVRRAGDGLVMERPGEDLRVTAVPVAPVAWADPAPLAGRYHSAELDAELEITAGGGAAYAVFTGLFGTGPAERMYPLGEDLWVISTRRSMDSAPPGEWTVQLRRDGAGAVVGLRVGCWLARNIDYRRVGAWPPPVSRPAT